MEIKLGCVFIEFFFEKIYNFFYLFFCLKKGGGGQYLMMNNKSLVYDDIFIFDCKFVEGGVLLKVIYGLGGN